jgi:penicillin-binding protein 1A
MVKNSNNTFAKKIIKWFWISFVAILFFFFFFFLSIAQGKIGYMPPIEDLENPINKYASQVISVDLKTMGNWSQSKENRIYVNYNELSPYLVQALIATEDERFFEHSGIDVYALVRAIVKRGLLLQKSGGGGSTISQQLAKQLYSAHAQTVLERLFQKPIEWVIAVQLERFYTKEEIINMYLNKFDFLYNAVGIQSACWVYFGKTPDKVTIEEAATLIGMCKNPSYFNPLRHKERTTGRRNVVLDLMQKNEYISKAAYDSIRVLPLVINYNKVDHKEGIAPYFREYLRLTMTAQKPQEKDYRDKDRYKEDLFAWENNPLYGWCNKNKKPDGSFYNLYTDGLKIYTTIDSRMQEYAEEAVREHMTTFLQPAFFRQVERSKRGPYSTSISEKELEEIMDRAMKQTDRYRGLKRNNVSDSQIETIFNTPVEMQVFSWTGPRDTIMSPMDSIRYMKSFIRTGFMAMDTHSGAVKAYVGGIDYKYFQYDMVNMGRRQVGSTIKPFLYAYAMESGFNPCDEVMHTQQYLLTETGESWEPRNTNKAKEDWVTISWGLQNSDNWVTAYLMKQLSPYAFKNKLIDSYGFSEPIDPVVSMCLGSCDVSVAQMVSGYSTFANGGMRVNPMYVTQIEDGKGNIVANFSPNLREVLSEDANSKTLSMLQSTIDGGTGARLRSSTYKLTVPLGGKTGTTQNNSDAWFIGFSPSIVGGAWVGGEERSIRFNSMSEGQGSRAALPIMALFLQKVYANPDLGYSQTDQFDIPERFRDPCATGGRGRSIDDSNVRVGVMDDIFN